MNLGSSAADLGLVIFLLIPGLLIPVLLLGLGALLGRVLRLPIIFTLIIIFGLIGGTLMASSVALDRLGRVVPAVVEQHDESVRVRSQGDWRHTMRIAVRYNLDGATPDVESATAGESSVSLAPPAAQFDRLRDGATTNLRVLPLVRSLALVRLADTTTRDVVPWSLVLLVGGGFVALIVVGQLMRSTIGGVVALAMIVAAGVSLPLYSAYQRSAQTDDLARHPLRATALVSTATRITEVDPFPCRPGSGSNCAKRRSRYTVAQPYDIVQMRYVPAGAAGEVIAVDAVDAGQPYVPGTSVEIAYSADQPRAAVIVGATHRHYGRNALGFALLFGGFALVLAAAFWWVVRRVRRPRRPRVHVVPSTN